LLEHNERKLLEILLFIENILMTLVTDLPENILMTLVTDLPENILMTW
jgi:hypothetical protein